MQRDLGLYCHDIESRVADGTLADVVWGNHDAIDQRLSGLGESRALTEWFALGENGSTETEVREILALAVKPEARVRMGDALAALGRTIGLTNADV